MNPHRAEDTAQHWLKALSDGDLPAYLDAFDPVGGSSSGPLAGQGIAGATSLKTLFQTLQSQLGATHYRADHFFTLGTEGLLAWTCEGQSRSGQSIVFQGMTAFRFSPLAKILSLEVFWDAATVLAQREDREWAPKRKIPLAQAFMEALNGTSSPQVRRVFSPEAEFEGALSAGTLKGAAVVAQHMIHARHQLGEPTYTPIQAFPHNKDVALLWQGELPGLSFRGGAVLRSGDGDRIDRVQMFWSPKDVKG